jgi:hypothetical protein
MKGDFLCVVLLLCENSARSRKMCDLLDSKGDILKVNTGKGVADHVCIIPGKEDCEI